MNLQQNSADDLKATSNSEFFVYKFWSRIIFIEICIFTWNYFCCHVLYTFLCYTFHNKTRFRTIYLPNKCFTDCEILCSISWKFLSMYYYHYHKIEIIVDFHVAAFLPKRMNYLHGCYLHSIWVVLSWFVAYYFL